MSHNRLNPADVLYWWVNNPTLAKFFFAMIGRANIKEPKSNTAMTLGFHKSVMHMLTFLTLLPSNSKTAMKSFEQPNAYEANHL